MVTDEMVEQGAEAAYENWRAGYVDATPFPGKPPSPWSELDNAKRLPTLENTRAALSTVAPLIAAQAHREAYDVAHAFARTGVDGILARLVDLMDGEIRPSDAVAQARREALEEAAAKLEYVAAELEADRAVIEPDSTYDDVAIRTLRTAITAIRALASQPAGDGWCYDMSKAPSGLVDLWDGEEVVVGFYVKGPDRSGWFFWDGECVWLEAVGDDFAELSAWKDGEGPVAWRFRPTPPKKARKEFDNDR